MIKKISALILALLLTLCMIACSSQDTDIPEGMQSATMEGEPFRLFVPQNWTSNVASGISGAYISPSSKNMVTARYYTPADESMTLEDYIEFCIASYEKSVDSFQLVEQLPAILGGEDAIKLSYTMKENETEMTCFQISVLYGGDFVSLNGYCATDSYASLSADFDLIVKEFVLCEKSDPQGEELTDKHTPEGMEIASADHIEYRFYVPKTWVCNAESGASEAYYPESGKSNVLLTSYVPETFTSIPDYFVQCEAEYIATLPEYERMSESERTVDGLSAYTYTYQTVVDGIEFRIMQTLFYYSESVYSLTYTALSDNFDLHLEDVEAMLDAFSFR